MGLCYFCGKEQEEIYQCQYCNLRFCNEHIKPEDHNCIAYKETSKFDIPEPASEPLPEPPVEEITIEPRRTQRKTGFDSNKQGLITMLLVFSLLSVAVLVYWNSNRGLEAVKPLETDYELHSVALAQVNVFRYRNDIPDLEYNADPIAQDHAWELMKAGDLFHNPDLPSNMGENVAVYTEHGIEPEIALALMVDRMVNNDEGFNYANRYNVLDPGYSEVSIGVAVDGDTVYLVLCFS